MRGKGPNLQDVAEKWGRVGAQMQGSFDKSLKQGSQTLPGQRGLD